MPSNRHYYINRSAQKVIHSTTRQEDVPEGYEYAGMSQLSVKSAAGFYTNNVPGYTIIDGDKNGEKASNKDPENSSG